MLTRESQLSLGKTLEAGYVLEKAKVARQDASSVLPSVTRVRRHVRSDTKRHTGDALPIESFLKKEPVLLARILAQAQAPLKDAAAVNSTRKALVKALEATGLPVETASGGKTKFNRTRLGIPKTHALDALCVGSMDEVGRWNLPTLTIKSMGRGSYQRTRVDASGFPRG